MKRVYLSGNVQPWRTRSMSLYRQRLIEALSKEDTDVELALLDPPAKQLPGKIGYQLARWWNYPRSISRLPDDALLHVTDQGYGELLPRYGGATLITVHDLIPLLMHEGKIPGARIGRLGWRLFQRALSGLRQADSILAVSRSTAQDLLALDAGMRGRIEVVPHGIEEDFFADHPERTPFGDSLCLGHVGNNWEYKNPLGVVTIASQIARQSQRPVRFLKVGDPLPQACLDILCREGIKAEHRHAADTLELIACYRQMDLLLFPSWYEGFGWPPLEAMAVGTPVLVSDRGSLAEYAAPGAAHVLKDPAGCQASEISKILSLLESDSLRDEAVAKGRESVQQFRWHKAAQHTLQLYRNLL